MFPGWWWIEKGEAAISHTVFVSHISEGYNFYNPLIWILISLHLLKQFGCAYVAGIFHHIFWWMGRQEPGKLYHMNWIFLSSITSHYCIFIILDWVFYYLFSLLPLVWLQMRTHLVWFSVAFCKLYLLISPCIYWSNAIPFLFWNHSVYMFT